MTSMPPFARTSSASAATVGPSSRIAAELAAQRRLVVDQDDLDAGGCRGERRGHARRAAAHDRDVGVAVLVVVGRLRRPVHADRS